MRYSYVAIFILTVCIVGCGDSYQDSYLYQPFDNKGSETIGIISAIPKEGLDLAGKSQYIVKISWKRANIFHNKIADSEFLIEYCTIFLEKTNYKREPALEECKFNNRYPWLTENRNLNSFREYWKKECGSKIFLPDIFTIVSLNPLVVIISSNCITNYPYSYLFTDDNNPNYRSIVLRDGFAYGTHTPYSQDLQWFSPDLNTPPHAVKMLSKTQGFISVPWGRLILTKEGDEWIVSAESK